MFMQLNTFEFLGILLAFRLDSRTSYVWCPDFGVDGWDSRDNDPSLEPTFVLENSS